LVDIDAESGGDLHAAGSRLSVNGTVTGEAWLAGAEVKIDAVITKALKAAGAWIDVTESAEIGADSSLAAALIEFHGTAQDNLSLYGDEVVFSGQASGAVTIKGREVRIADNARIEGDLNIQSMETADVAPTATVVGKVTQTSLTDWEVGEEDNGVFAGFGGILFFAAGIFLFGLMLVIFMRGSVEQGIKVLRSQPGKSILWGLATFFGVPLLAVLVMVTVIGIPIGLATLFILPLLLLLGFTTGVFGLSDWLLNRSGEGKETGQRLLLLLAGVVIYVILSLIPFLGTLFVIFVLLIGLGAAVVTVGCRLASRANELPA
jgi:cytoskeletal protein CcmA (bactofilin family)